MKEIISRYPEYKENLMKKKEEVISVLKEKR